MRDWPAPETGLDKKLNITMDDHGIMAEEPRTVRCECVSQTLLYNILLLSLRPWQPRPNVPLIQTKCENTTLSRHGVVGERYRVQSVEGSEPIPTSSQVNPNVFTD